ncbi:hypothetical protein CPB83DRAFT_861844, partial [Crepidotus variabilis]
MCSPHMSTRSSIQPMPHQEANTLPRLSFFHQSTSLPSLGHSLSTSTLLTHLNTDTDLSQNQPIQQHYAIQVPKTPSIARVSMTNFRNLSSETTRGSHTSSKRFNAPLPTRNSVQGRPYPPHLPLKFSILRPHCPAQDRLAVWKPLQSRRSFSNSPSLIIDREDSARISMVIEARWDKSTRETYGSGLLTFHSWCDSRNVPELERCPVSHITLITFIASCSGSYSASALRNMVHGIHVWHTLHGQPWSVVRSELDAVLGGGGKLAPISSKKAPRPPVTVEIIKAVYQKLNLNTPLDAAVYACLTTIFWSTSRVGEFTLPSLKSFDSQLHIKRSNIRQGFDRNNLQVTIFHLPHTKCSPTGEDVYWASQSGVADPNAALNNHLLLNNPSNEEFLFSYSSNSGCHPLTRNCFLTRINNALSSSNLPPIQGIPFDVVKSLGRWSSEAFTKYLREHAIVIAPYIQDSAFQERFLQYTMPPVR